MYQFIRVHKYTVSHKGDLTCVFNVKLSYLRETPCIYVLYIPICGIFKSLESNNIPSSGGKRCENINDSIGTQFKRKKSKNICESSDFIMTVTNFRADTIFRIVTKWRHRFAVFQQCFRLFAIRGCPWVDGRRRYRREGGERWFHGKYQYALFVVLYIRYRWYTLEYARRM